MDGQPGRIKITALRDGETLIVIKGHNSFLHAFILVLIESAIFSAYYILSVVLAAIAGRLGLNPAVVAISWMLAGVTIFYRVTAVFLLLRSLLWTAAGYERLTIGAGTLKYSKTVLGIGIYRRFTAQEAQTIKEVDFIQEKNILYMLKSELLMCGNSFVLKGKNGNFRFGRYLTIEENDALLKAVRENLLQNPS
ncbi:MAG: hypothetical protein LLG37_02040 [Spirochaetia bacterium]|nr:hypothetical protein [Spirochaetia bacterium]